MFGCVCGLYSRPHTHTHTRLYSTLNVIFIDVTHTCVCACAHSVIEASSQATIWTCMYTLYNRAIDTGFASNTINFKVEMEIHICISFVIVVWLIESHNIFDVTAMVRKKLLKRQQINVTAEYTRVRVHVHDKPCVSVCSNRSNALNHFQSCQRAAHRMM